MNDQLKKIMIIYADSGAGHRRAAEALYQVVTADYPAAQVQLFDALQYTTAVFRQSYPRTYLYMVNHCPWLWGSFYHMLDNGRVDRFARAFRRQTNAQHCRKLEKYLLQEQPDLVLTTHFLPNEIITHLKRRHGFRTFLATCITDYYPHIFWRDRGVDLYFTPHEELTPCLIRMGIPAERIRTLGIPIVPAFSRPADRNALRRKFHLADDRLTVLIASGGFGVGPVEDLVVELDRVEKPLQVLVICGKNPRLQEELTRLTQGARQQFQIYGFVDNMHELMEASDLMISKSGGLTVTEAMAKGLPLLVLNPIPGQETGNCQFLLRHGAGLRVKDPAQAREVLESLLDHPEQLAGMRENMRKLGRPDAAREILSAIATEFPKER
ncbi:processive 1,2-diacylglycerol beta-glucosyltransferase [Hydrogenispora ethanolica]|uniref:Processive 1,2-diacylglycerol beta-glucosyltransferase n=1 Tax=Hydrogenispora ethanolica TaxID=1082276 RepID=A0A4R1S2I2_HYDET|nr:glycosyltransferase [Hydrogenispora ethanolica]TCL73229.1 processive 1,2-diacylglycerol beta-glucosyltransferase [Hydrogenispora ethanolica]